MNRRILIVAVAFGALTTCLIALHAQNPPAHKVAVNSIAEVVQKNPIDKATGRAITPIGNGQFSTVTVWQFKTGISPHLHREHDEVIYCEQGEGIARLGDEKVPMKPGDFVIIPPNMPHGVTVTSKEPMRGISVFSPIFDGKDRVPVNDDGRPTTVSPALNTQHSTLIPLIHAHAHNDYEHKRPLFDALDQGFCSVEADVWLVDGKLLVAHDRNKVTPERTLESLYLDPLRDRIRTNKGSVYGIELEFSLLIDIKSDAGPTYTALREVLARYSDILTSWEGGTEVRRAITVVVSGNRDPDAMRAEKRRYAALDGRPPDLDGDYPPGLYRWISASWFSLFKWSGIGLMPAGEREKLRKLVETAHAKGYRVRFWGTLDLPNLWKEQRAAGVDLINADDLSGAHQFLLSEGRETPNGSTVAR